MPIANEMPYFWNEIFVSDPAIKSKVAVKLRYRIVTVNFFSIHLSLISK